jgi:thiamine-monophosphate kinase
VETIASLGENASLKRTISRLNKGDHELVGPGDDAAVIKAIDGSYVVTTDTLVQDHDFKLEWSSGYDLGWKAVASNIADVAAMGAVPTVLVVALVAPGATEVSWLEAFADGLREACLALAPGCAVVGGDLASGAQIVISVTAHGSLEGRQPVLRSGAKAGDVLAVAGTLGRAACGLDLLASGNTDAANAYDEMVAVQLRPQPPISAGVAASNAGATAMLDVSDGLVKDASRIAAASGVRISIDAGQLIGFEAVLEGPAQALAIKPGTQTEAQYTRKWVLGGGEDHALLATFPADATLPRGFKRIGSVVSSATLDSADSSSAANSDQPGVLLGSEPLTAAAIDALGWDSVTGI